MCSLLKGAQVVSADIEILDEAASPAAMTVETDVADAESVRRLFEHVTSALGRPQ